MHMVCNAIDNNCLTTSFIDEIADNSEEIFLPSLIDKSRSVFNRKNSLDVNLMVRVCHEIQWFNETAYISHPYGILVDGCDSNSLE